MIIGSTLARALAAGSSLLALAVAMPAVAQTAPAPAAQTGGDSQSTPPTPPRAVTPATAPAGVTPAESATAAADPSAQTAAGEPAQPAASETAPGSDVIVTGSRAITNGASAPTPVTVVSAAQLSTARPGNVAEAVGELPVFRGSTRASTAGSAGTTLGAGANLLSLRALAPFRTLLLLDGRRVTPTQLNGATDANLIPQSLIKRVDVVTGGASAAYGSDAIAGVVNFVLDSHYTGLKGTIQGGISSRNDAATMKVNLTGGTALADGRLHLIGSADYFRQEGIGLDFNGRRWAEAGYGLIGQSTTSSALVVAPDVRDVLDTAGGLIIGCAPATATCPIARMQFNQNGSLSPYTQGQFISSSTMSGGDGAARRTNLVAGYDLKSFFGRAAYDLSEGTSVFVEGTYSELRSHYFGSDSGENGTANATIYSGNPFLPAAVQAVLTANNIASFSFGRTNFDFGGSYYTNTTRTRRVVGGIDGGLGGSWKYSAYAEYGRVTFDLLTSNNVNVERIYNAIDAVRDPATGQTVCRTTLLGLAIGQGCVPINLFGERNESGPALAYVKTTTFLNNTITQFVASASVRGEPLTLPAGPVSFATGLEYRRETGEQSSGPDNAVTRTGTGIRGYPAAQVNQLGAYFLSPAQGYSGDFNVKEGFVEVAVPVLRDVTAFHNLDLNGAARYADYSSVGSVFTWKLGANWVPFDGIRFRGTRSRDIRAPSILERFSPQTPVTGQPVNDPQKNGARFTVVQLNQGNPNLNEEKADTTTFGVVLRPVRGLSLSVDHFNIRINDVISAPTRDAVVAACGLSACPQVIRNPDGTINSVITQQQNLAQLRTSGEDFEIGYVTPIAALGTLSLRALATYTKELTLTIGATTIDRVGDLNVTPSSSPPGVARWTGTFSVDFQGSRLHLFAQERYVGPGSLDKTQVYATTQDTHVPRVFYTDLTAGYRLPTAADRFELYLTINNLLDKDPPITPNGSTTTPRPANGSLYDFLGRYFTVGARMAF